MKTHDLSPKHNYIIANHPHGIVSYGVFINFATEATGFAQIFPDITPSVGTLEGIFWIPIVREYVMSLGEYQKSFPSLTYLRAPTPIIPNSQSNCHSLLEEDGVENESRTHCTSSIWLSIGFCPQSGRQGLVRQQGKLWAFISFQEYIQRRISRLKFKIKAKVESRRQKPNIKPKCRGNQA